MGAEPTQFAAAAELLVHEGYDVVDINFGCPVKKVLGRCRGGFLLTEPETALEIVARCATRCRRTCRSRSRCGAAWTTRRERATSSSRSSTRAFDLGVAAITVHGRTVVQRYVGPQRLGVPRPR